MLSINGEMKSSLINANKGGWSRNELVEEANRRGLDFPSNATKAQLYNLLISKE